MSLLFIIIIPNSRQSCHSEEKFSSHQLFNRLSEPLKTLKEKYFNCSMFILPPLFLVVIVPVQSKYTEVENCHRRLSHVLWPPVVSYLPFPTSNTFPPWGAEHPAGLGNSRQLAQEWLAVVENTNNSQSQNGRKIVKYAEAPAGTTWNQCEYWEGIVKF